MADPESGARQGGAEVGWRLVRDQKAIAGNTEGGLWWRTAATRAPYNQPSRFCFSS